MNKMRRGSEQDDPYSDWWMLRIEDKLDQTKTTLQSLREQVDQALASVPPALSLGENLNVQPVKLPLFVNAQLGFAAVYLLADYDDIARKLILAHHTALIDRSTLERWLNEGAHALRSLFSLAQQYRYSGCTRDDFAAKNAAARAALEKFGELPQDVLEGTRRSKFAPPIVRRGLQQRGESPAAAPAPNDEAATTEAARGRRRRGRGRAGMSDPNREPRYFQGLQQAAFMKLEHAASLKGLLKPFKGKGDLRPGPASASPCATS
jgi:integrating conjugative element protein (TIGR03761 family)